jgi:hypothetical protein
MDWDEVPQWWLKTGCGMFPALGKVFQSLLAMPGGAAALERDFSIASNILTVHRARLDYWPIFRNWNVLGRDRNGIGVAHVIWAPVTLFCTPDCKRMKKPLHSPIGTCMVGALFANCHAVMKGSNEISQHFQLCTL